MIFNRGDTVIAHKPKNTKETPGWLPSMDKYDGMSMTIYADRGGIVYVQETGYKFNSKWLELITDCEDLSCESFEDLL